MSTDDATLDWWEQRRLKYNLGLIVSGFLAFVCYVLILDRAISTGAMPDAEITIFTTAFQAIGYLFMMGVANLCYCAGAFVESHYAEQPNVERYRRMAFRFGFWFSVLLPFTIPGLVGLSWAWHTLVMHIQTQVGWAMGVLFLVVFLWALPRFARWLSGTARALISGHNQ